MNLDLSIEHILQLPIPEERREILQILVDYIQKKKSENEPVILNFICTHNSRRSLFSQVWAAGASHAFKIKTTCLSGGIEITEINKRTVASLSRFGFLITTNDTGVNPKYTLEYALQTEPLILFSKLYSDEVNKFEKFASVMTCDHADENCPVIPGAEQRISVNYSDPKEFDGSELESAKYDERSSQIASEMFYVFSKIN